jgi:beta-fructofuranosidase
MAFSLPDHWVWDFWLADDGTTYHLFYLHAPHALGNPDLRHRNARIGHATSSDLIAWQDHGRIFDVGAPGSFDDTATWTGSVVRGPDGRWRLYYTGSRFRSPTSNANIETIGMAVSDDLFNWQKLPGPIAVADAGNYETLGSSAWPEEAFRDPWVFLGEDGQWHMLVTARANHGEVTERGVVGHAISPDMENWQVRPPLSAINAGFAHIEVPQIVEVEGTLHLIFCCDSPKLSGRLAGQKGGIWSVAVASPLGPYAIDRATLLAPEELYAGRIAFDRGGHAMLLAFNNTQAGGVFAGSISDPMPIRVDRDAGELPTLALEAQP